ncbi:hypothetical protein BGX38DRAFT_312891 [Terfezia claveryi]|nr:hypothetical protein BGX38DRAFT_312891 [Terfezia claveryi]
MFLTYIQWVDPKSQGMDTGHHSLSFLTISRSNLSKFSPLTCRNVARNYPPSLPLSETVVYAKNIPSTLSPESPGGISPRSTASTVETCLHVLASFRMFANSYIKSYPYLWPNLPAAIQLNSSCNSSHVFPSSPPPSLVRNRCSSLVYRFRPPAGKRLRNLTVDCDGSGPLLDRGFDIAISLPPYMIVRTGRPRLVYMH